MSGLEVISKAAVGRILGVTREHARVLVKSGCPTTTAEDVLKWRELNPPKRMPTNGKKRAASVVVKSQRQKSSEKAVTGSKNAAEPKWKQPKIPQKTGDSLLDALNNAIHVADRAFEEYLFACENKLASIPLRLSEHNKALDARLKAEKAYREEQERRGVLTEKKKIYEICRIALEEVLRRIKRLPAESGPQCNRDNPMMAVKILEREVNAIIASGKAVIDDLK
jgi:hypothetical protein